MTIILPNHNEPNIDLLTKRLALRYPEAQIVVANDPSGKGKGWAMREGLSHSHLRPFIFLDGDDDIKVEEIEKLLPFLKQYDIVVGRKGLPKSFKRKFITILSRIYIRLLFGIKYDTQTGLKGFNYEPKWKTNGWGFDIEILYKAKKLHKRIIEVPIIATVSDSKTLGDIWKTFVESLKIRFLL